MEGVSRAGRGRTAKGVAIAALLALLAIAPAAEAKGTAYVAGGNAAGEVAPFSIGAAGELTALTKAPAGGTPRSVAITPNAQNLYASFLGAGTPGISAYSIAPAGTLTPVTGSPFLLGAGNAPEGLAISPNGQVLYVAQQGSNSIAALAIGGGGVLTPISTTPVAGFGQGSIAVAPDGQRLYATTSTGVVSFTIGANGALTAAGGPFPAGTTPRGIAIAPNGGSLYVSNTGSNNVTAFAVAGDGSLTSLGNSPAGTTPATVAVSQTGAFVYIANPGSDNVAAYAIGADGSLTAVPGQPFSAAPGDETFGLDAAPGASRVYATNRVTANITGFNVAADGALSQIAGSPFPAGVVNPEFQSIAITPNQGPASHFFAPQATAGQALQFDGTGSVDPDGGTVARFDWDFGDGQTLPDGGPSPTHTYAAPGSYNVTLTVTDDEGCSNVVLFTGQTADCNGPAAARSQETIQVIGGGGGGEPPDLKLSGKKKQELRRTVTVKARTDDPTDAVAKGRVVIEGPKQGRRALRSFRLKKDTEALAADTRTKLKPKLSRKAFKKAESALRKRGKVTAKITVKATDADANADTAKLNVKLTR